MGKFRLEKLLWNFLFPIMHRRVILLLKQWFTVTFIPFYTLCRGRLSDMKIIPLKWLRIVHSNTQFLIYVSQSTDLQINDIMSDFTLVKRNFAFWNFHINKCCIAYYEFIYPTSMECLNIS